MYEGGDPALDQFLTWWSSKAHHVDTIVGWDEILTTQHPDLAPWTALFVQRFDDRPNLEENFICARCGKSASSLIGESYEGRYFGELADPSFLYAFRDELGYLLKTGQYGAQIVSLPRSKRGFMPILRAVVPCPEKSEANVVLLIVRPTEAITGTPANDAS